MRAAIKRFTQKMIRRIHLFGRKYFHISLFDEFYFGQFANYYCNRIFVFDIHPPLTKLTHYFIGNLLAD